VFLWNNEELNKKAREFIKANASVKGKRNLTAGAFCQWVNGCLLVNNVLEPGYPRRISISTALRWLHNLGFQVIKKKKGTYVDGHERSDVIEYRQKFLQKMVANGFLNRRNMPMPSIESAFPSDLESPPDEVVDKTILIFHDESTFQANDEESWMWGEHGQCVLKPKSRGSGIMVSDFIDEHNGYLRLTDEEFSRSYNAVDGLKQEARAFLEYGKEHEGYWTAKKFLAQLEDATKVAKIKYPKDDGYRVSFVFDHSSCHGTFAEDALDASKMNLKPGGKQPRMHDTIWNGKVQKMVFPDGTPKGLKAVLIERGINVTKMKLEDMRTLIATHADFRDEQPEIAVFLRRNGFGCIFLPKFHCELNPIEKCWSQAKRYTRAHANYMIQRLRATVPQGLDSVSLENIRNYFRKARHYMFAYLEGYNGGNELEQQVKRYKKIYQSHRRPSTVD